MASSRTTTSPIRLSPAGLQIVQNDPKLIQSCIKMASPHGFREFLNYWHFLDQDTGIDRVLGDVLWDAQEEFVATATREDWIFFLKARQLGETTIECAFDGWVARWRDVNGRVHVFSKRDEEAIELLDRVKYGIDSLPEWMQLPKIRVTTHELQLDASTLDEDGNPVADRRMVKAYPADKNPSRSATCTHAHLDEWTFMGDPRRVWQAVEPSAAGTVHFVTTGEGPQNYTSEFWLRCLAGDVKTRKGDPVHPCFIGALGRPDRSEEWLRAKKAGMDEASFNWEYPTSWEQALSGGGDFVFRSSDIYVAREDSRGLSEPQPGRKYAKGADIGRHQDAAVIVVLDITEDVFDVVYYKRMREATYPEIQLELEQVHKKYRGPLGVEKNAAGEAVIENLKLHEEIIKRAKFVTSPSSKARIISQLNLQLQNQLLRWDPDACSQLDAEMRGYQTPDDNIVQDSVMALAIALEYAPQGYEIGKLAGTWQM